MIAVVDSSTICDKCRTLNTTSRLNWHIESQPGRQPMNKEKYLKRFQNLDMHNLNTLYAKHRKKFTDQIPGKHQSIQDILLLAVISADLCVETFNDLFSASISYFKEEDRQSTEKILDLINENSDKAVSRINEVTSKLSETSENDKKILLEI
jgi:hypothetical protein